MDASGRPLARTLGNGLVETRTYDDVGRLTRLELTNSSMTIMHWWTWQYDAAGNLSERRDSAGRWWRGTYDNLDRLLSEETPSSQRAYTYDRAGRRNNDSSFGTISYGSATGVHDQAPTRLARALVVYDANGNVIAGNGRAIGNDAMGFPRRVSYVRRGLHWTSIAPDGLGRIGKTRPLFGRSVVWWGDRALCRGTRCTDRVFDNFGIAFEADHERRWFHVDQGGTPLAWSDAKGGVHVIELSSGGALITGDRSDAIPLFHGQRQIGSTGLYLFGERLYDPELGFFLSADSSVAVGAPAESWNRYLFARGNPARFEDPDGRQPSDFSWSSSTYSWSMNYSWYQNYSFDVAVYSAQLREFNARRFDVFTQNPQKFLVELKQQPMSIGTIPSLRSAIDYMPHGSVFAPLPEGESFAKNIAILQGDPAEFTGRLTDLFASVVAPGRTLVKFATLSKSGSTWDYKSRVRNYLTIDRLLAENAGNFAYGVHGASIGLSLEALLQAAGAVQVISNGTRSQYLKGLATGEYGFPGLIPPYGDDAIDQYWIMRGYYYYHQSYRQMQQAPGFP
jgi:RHS repeat-associated protein